MKSFKRKKNKLNTIKIWSFIVFFLIIINTIYIYKRYVALVNDKGSILLDEKTDKILAQFLTDLITDDVINKNSIGSILDIHKNSNGEILAINYNLEETYKILTKTSTILKDAINNLENGKYNVHVTDEYLEESKNGLVLKVPLFLGVDNIFMNNLGPKIPVKINFNGELLTNIKTKVTDYGFNNALLEIYICVQIDKLIITPIKKKDDKFYYNILINAIVVNGKVPTFYGTNYEKSSNILDVPI